MYTPDLTFRPPEMSKPASEAHEVAMISGLIMQHVSFNHRGELASFLESLYTHLSKVIPVEPLVNTEPAISPVVDF